MEIEMSVRQACFVMLFLLAFLVAGTCFVFGFAAGIDLQFEQTIAWVLAGTLFGLLASATLPGMD